MRITVGAAAALALVILCYFAFSESNSLEGARIQELEQQVADLKAQLAESRDRPAHTQPAPSRTTAFEQGQPTSARSDQIDRVQELAVLVERFEQAARELNDRITRSKLNLPTSDELRVQIEKARAELEKVRNSAQRKQAVVCQIAASLNVHLGIDALLEPGASNVLDANPAFVSARSAAREERKLQLDIEQRYSELRFQMVIDAKPIKLTP